MAPSETGTGLKGNWIGADLAGGRAAGEDLRVHVVEAERDAVALVDVHARDLRTEHARQRGARKSGMSEHFQQCKEFSWALVRYFMALSGSVCGVRERVR